jgi:hypothetical protein
VNFSLPVFPPAFIAGGFGLDHSPGLAADGHADLHRLILIKGGIMQRLHELLERIIQRVNVNLREPLFDVGPYVGGWFPGINWSSFMPFTVSPPFTP